MFIWHSSKIINENTKVLNEFEFGRDLYDWEVCWVVETCIFGVCLVSCVAYKSLVVRIMSVCCSILS